MKLKKKFFSLYILIFIVIISCSNINKNDSGIYHIIIHKKFDINDSTPPFLSRFYGDFNFILFDSTTIYVNQKSVLYYCGTGLDQTKPPFLFLKPEHLIQLKTDSLQLFLKENITDSIYKNGRFSASISSPTDTIKNEAFQIITDYFKAYNLMQYEIRRCTEEELYVATAKKTNTKYNKDSVEWKTGFNSAFQFDSRLR
jgi:hypothetical protein